MKKNKLIPISALGVVFILFNVIAFAVPTEKTATFFTAYGFTVIAFAAQAVVWKLAFDKKETAKSAFLGIPIAYVSVLYLAVQLVAFAVFMVFPALPVWVSVVVNAVILAAFLFFALVGQIGVAEIDRVEKNVKTKRSFIALLQTDIEMLAEREEESNIKSALLKLAEVVRFSDPMSCDELAALEARISDTVSKIDFAKDKIAAIREAELLLTERNKKCKILK